MRTRTITATVLALAAVALATLLGAAPAAAQTPDPPDPVLGLQYDLMNAGSVKLHGAAADYDRPLLGDYVRLAAGGAFVAGESLNHFFAGAGPGVRHDTGTVQVWAHALFGYRRDMVTKGFDARFGAGIDYPLGRKHSFRAGAAYGGDVHVTAGMSFRF